MSRCECPDKGVLYSELKNFYDPIKELPFVKHEENKCKCVNNIHPYIRNHKKIWLCSNCKLPSDKRL